jgi:hypothetical protein
VGLGALPTTVPQFQSFSSLADIFPSVSRFSAKQVGNGAAMKFEAVLLDNQVNRVISGLFTQNLQPDNEVFTALHNHYLGDSPQIRFMHGFAVGDAVKLAAARTSLLLVIYCVILSAAKPKSAVGFGRRPPLSGVRRRWSAIKGWASLRYAVRRTVMVDSERRSRCWSASRSL